MSVVLKFDLQVLETAKRRDLQSWAKQHGFKANAKVRSARSRTCSQQPARRLACSLIIRGLGTARGASGGEGGAGLASEPRCGPS